MNLEKLYSKQEISEETVKELKENPYPSYELGIIVDSHDRTYWGSRWKDSPLLCGGWTFVIYGNEIEVEGTPVELFKM